MKKKLFAATLCLLLALTASLLSAGCSDDSGEDQAAENGQEATETLKVGDAGQRHQDGLYHFGRQSGLL